MVYEDIAERHRFDSFCKVVLRHAMLDCFREFSYQNKWLVSLNYLQQPIMDGICTTDQYPSDYITFSADGYTLQISNEQLANIIEELPQPERRLLILCFVLELNDREIGRRMCCSRSAIQRRRTSVLRTMVDESGQTYKQVDLYMKGRLQSKLMQAITKK